MSDEIINEQNAPEAKPAEADIVVSKILETKKKLDEVEDTLRKTLAAIDKAKENAKTLEAEQYRLHGAYQALLELGISLNYVKFDKDTQ